MVWWRYPRPDFNAGDRRFVALLQMLAGQYIVDFVIPFSPAAALDEAGVDALRTIDVNLMGVGWDALTGALARRRYDLVLFEFYRLFADYAPVIRERQPGAKIVIDTVDVHFAREETAARLGLHAHADAARTKQDELAAYRAADAVIAVTKEDAAILEHEQIGSVFVIPIIVPLRERSTLKVGAEVLFVGGFSHAPNLDAVRWFIQDIWPRVIAAAPDARFHVVGSNPPEELRMLGAVPGVVVHGYVPDTAPFLDRASVSVAPLRYGAGMKGKVNEALAAGVPVVTTSFGAQGLGLVPGVHAIVTDDAEAFAAAIVALLQDPARAAELGGNGQCLAKAFSPEVVESAVHGMLITLLTDARVRVHAQWLGASARTFMRAGWRRIRRGSTS